MAEVNDKSGFDTKLQNNSKYKSFGFETVSRIRNKLLSGSNQIHIIVGSIIFGIIIWLFDSLFHYLTISNISFINSITDDIPGHETLMRALIIISFFIFGLISARMIKKIVESKNELQKSEEKYKSFIEGTDNLVAQVDATGRFTYVNHTSCTVFGLEPEECIGLLASDFIHPDDRQRTLEDFENWIKNKSQSITYENRQVSRTGEVRDIIWTINPVYDNNGDLMAINSIGRSITERKEMEKELQASEERFKSLFENAPLGYQSLDTNGNIIEINETWCNLLGYTKEEVIGRNFSEFIHPDFKEHFKITFPKFKKLGQILGVEFEMIRKDGSEIIVSLSGKISYDKDGSFKQSHCVLNDITDHKMIERRFRSTHADLIGEQLKLRSKNNALKEVLKQIDDEKRLMKSQIQTNTNRIILPLLDSLKEKGDENQNEQIEILEKSLSDITSPFINRLEIKYSNLSPRELEICNMLREGLSTKQIASKLDISFHTVLKQRQNIRKKLGISNADINLYSYLQSISSNQVKQN